MHVVFCHEIQKGVDVSLRYPWLRAKAMCADGGMSTRLLWAGQGTIEQVAMEPGWWALSGPDARAQAASIATED